MNVLDGAEVCQHNIPQRHGQETGGILSNICSHFQPKFEEEKNVGGSDAWIDFRMKYCIKWLQR